ncbi:hypothetical protein, partial [Pseudomonas taiwanensis]|uniref:hypothetical protein n=1 Tax=Pseudomonas taiwanensis TaxID=470150 RepID=UPI001EE2BEF9
AALKSVLQSFGLWMHGHIHLPKRRSITFPLLQRVTFWQTPQKVAKKVWRHDSPTWVTNQITHIGNSL